MMLKFVVLVAMTGALACGGSAKRSSDLLRDVRAFNEGLRWEKLPQSALRIHPSEREAFLDEREQLQDDLRIDDFEIMRLKLQGKRAELANVQIKWTWHMDSRGIVKTTTSKQQWRRFGKQWLMLQEAHVRGDLMPGVPEMPDTEDAADTEDAENAEVGQDEAEKAGQELGLRARPGLRESLAYRRVEAALHAAQKTPTIAE